MCCVVQLRYTSIIQLNYTATARFELEIWNLWFGWWLHQKLVSRMDSPSTIALYFYMKLTYRKKATMWCRSRRYWWYRRCSILLTIFKNKNASDFMCTTPPDFVIPRGLSTLYRYSLTTRGTRQTDKPYHEEPLNRDCYNHMGSCTLYRPWSTIAAGICSSSFVRNNII